MPQFFEKLNRRYGGRAPSGVIKGIIAGRIVVWALIMFINSNAYYLLSLDRAALLRGQVWRLLTFVFVPDNLSVSPTAFLYFAIELYFLYFIGTSLENNWGSFYFDCYLGTGLLAAVLSCLLVGFNVNFAITESLFFAFAAMFPNVEVLLFFILPIKVKWLGIASAVIYAFNFFGTSLAGKIALVLGVANFIVFFAPDFINRLRNRGRRQQWQQQWKNNNYRF